jgi:RNA polymerase sigma-70 factor (ECF subfamily)
VDSRDEELDGLLERARGGDAEALGRLLEHYASYLKLIAAGLLGSDLKVRVGASDLVQETFLDACRDFPRFHGGTEAELVSWLRQILVHNLADLACFHHAGRRDVRRQRSLEQELGHSSLNLHAALAAPVPSPSAMACRREEAVLLANALEKLPADYQDVFIERSLKGVSFEDLSTRMGRSPHALRLLWGRAIVKLSRMLEGPS